MSDTLSEPVPRPCSCPFADATPEHHDQLLRAPADLSMTLELIELAVTWEELDYSAEALIPPGDWPAFVACHDWVDPEMAARIFDVAIDVARARTAASRSELFT